MLVELGEGEAGGEALAERIREAHPRDAAGRRPRSSLVPFGTLPRSDYKSKLVDWSEAVED